MDNSIHCTGVDFQGLYISENSTVIHGIQDILPSVHSEYFYGYTMINPNFFFV